MTIARLSPRVKQSVRDADRLYQVPSLKMSAAIPPLPLAYMACLGKTLPFPSFEALRWCAVYDATWQLRVTVDTMSAPDCDLANDCVVETRRREWLLMWWAVGQPWSTDRWLTQASTVPEAMQPFPNHFKGVFKQHNVSFMIIKNYTAFFMT
jgi:hypothetical protein